MFSILTLFSLLVLISALFFHHYRRIRNLISKDSTDFKITNYFFWQVKRISGLFKTSIKKDCQKLLHKVLYLRYPTAEKWSIILLSLSFVLLAASGFIYALFIAQSLYGYPLLLHVILGGVFSVCLSIVVALQAPFYSFHKETESSIYSASRGKVRRHVTVAQKILFWLFAISGLLQALTALSLMLPVFSLTTQMSVVAIHRYSALGALLSAIAFFYFTLVKNGK